MSPDTISLPKFLRKKTFDDENHASTKAHGPLSGTLAAQDLDDLYGAMLVSMKTGKKHGGSEISSSYDTSHCEADDSEGVFEDCPEML